MMRTFSSIPPIIPYGGFSPVRLQGWRISGPSARRSAQACSRHPPAADGLSSPFVPRVAPVDPALCRAEGFDCTAVVDDDATAPGALARVGLFCPGPSTLNRPHPPHSQARRDFTAWRLIRDAFAVRERLGDPRVVPCFRCSFLPDMPSSPTPGSWTSTPRTSSDIGLRLMTTGSALPTLPQSVPRGRSISWLTGSLPLQPARLLAPLYGSDWKRPAFGDFYFQAFDGSVSLPVAGYNYNVTGLLCWRDFHPLEWQLASLHGQKRPICDGRVTSASTLRRAN